MGHKADRCETKEGAARATLRCKEQRWENHSSEEISDPRERKVGPGLVGKDPSVGSETDFDVLQ